MESAVRMAWNVQCCAGLRSQGACHLQWQEALTLHTCCMKPLHQLKLAVLHCMPDNGAWRPLQSNDDESWGMMAIGKPACITNGCDTAGADDTILILHAGLFHLQGLSVLCWDERPVRLASSDDEELWRLMYRRSGMGRLEFKQALKLGRCLSCTCHRPPSPASLPALPAVTSTLCTQVQLTERAGDPVLCNAASAAGQSRERPARLQLLAVCHAVLQPLATVQVAEVQEG